MSRSGKPSAKTRRRPTTAYIKSPIIVIHGNALDGITEPYKRYLEKHFRDTFDLVVHPVSPDSPEGNEKAAQEYLASCHFIDHDDGYSADPTYMRIDDLSVINQ